MPLPDVYLGSLWQFFRRLKKIRNYCRADNGKMRLEFFLRVIVNIWSFAVGMICEPRNYDSHFMGLIALSMMNKRCI
jgi:hypothetical protein